MKEYLFLLKINTQYSIEYTCFIYINNVKLRCSD